MLQTLAKIRFILSFACAISLLSPPALANTDVTSNPVLNYYKRQIEELAQYDINQTTTSAMTLVEGVRQDSLQLEHIIRNTRKEVLTFHNSIIHGSIPALTCNEKSDDVVATTGIYLTNDIQTMQNRWSRLIETDFLFVNLLMDSRALVKGLKSKDPTIPVKKYCNALRPSVKALECFYDKSQNVKSCAKEYSKAIGNDIIIGNFYIAERQLLSTTSPFLAIEVKNKLNSINRLVNDRDVILDVLVEGFTQAIKSQAEYQSSLAIAHVVGQMDEWVVKAFGINPTAAKTLITAAVYNKPVPYSTSELVDTAAKEMGTEADIARIQANLMTAKKFRSDVLAAIASIKSLGLENIKKEAFDTAKAYVEQSLNNVGNSIESPRLVVRGKLNGQYTKKGEALYNISLHLQIPSLRTTKIILKSKFSNGKNNPLFCKNTTPCKDHSKATYEEHNLNINIRNVIQLPNKKGWQLYSLRYDPINSMVVLDGEQLNQILRAYGVLVPFEISGENVSFKTSNNLKRIDITATAINPFFPSTPISITIPLLKDGKLVSPIDINKNIANQLNQKLIQKHAADWFSSLKIVKKSHEQVNELIALIPNNNIKIVPVTTDDSKLDNKHKHWANQIIGYDVIASFTIKSGEPDLQKWLPSTPMKLTLRITQNGLRLNTNNLSSVFEKQLRIASRRHIETFITGLGLQKISKDALSLVSPYFTVVDNNLTMKIDFSISGRFVGCDITKPASSTFPFDDIKETLKITANDINNEIEDCAKKIAINKLDNLLSQGNIELFGVSLSKASEASPLGNQQFQFDALLKDTDSQTKQIINGLIFDVNKLDVSFRQVKNMPEVSKALGKIITHRLYKLVGKKHLELESPSLSEYGYSFNPTLKKIPYIGELSLERITIGKTTRTNDLDNYLKKSLKTAVNKALKTTLNRNLNIPDIGPIQGIDVGSVGFGSQGIELSFNGNLQLPQNTEIPVEVHVLPLGCNVQPNRENSCVTLDITKGIIQNFLAIMEKFIPLKFPNSPIQFIPKPRPIFIPDVEAYGIEFGLVIDLNIVKVSGAGATISHKGIFPPKKIGANVGAEIPIPPFSIANPGVTYTFGNGGGFGINGQITFAKKEIAKILHIRGELNVTDIKTLEFTLDGDMVLADTLSVYTTTGYARLLKNPLVEYESGTSPAIAAIIDAKNSGRLDGPGRFAETKSSLKILGLKITDSEYRIAAPTDEDRDGVMSFKGYQTLLIGDANLKVGSGLLLQNPFAEADMKVKVGGWDVMKGGLKVNMSHAHLNFKALGIKINVITPSVNGLTPSLLAKILADLLKIDLKSLLKNPNLKEITISLVNADGTPGGTPGQPPTPAKGGGSDGIAAPPSGGTRAPNTAPEPSSTGENKQSKEKPEEGKRNKIHETEPLADGYYGCLEMLPKRYEFWRIYGAYDSKEHLGHKHKKNQSNYQNAVEDWHAATFLNSTSMFKGPIYDAKGNKIDSNTPALFCNGNSINDEEWIPISARQKIQYDQYAKYNCSTENTMDILITGYDKATWNEDGHGYYCGQIPSGAGVDFKANRKFEPKNDFERNEDIAKAIERKSSVYDATQYEQIKLELYNRVKSQFPAGARPVYDHEQTKLMFDHPCWICWSNKSTITIQVHFEPASDTLTWKQSFHLIYNHSNKNIYYVSMCQPTEKNAYLDSYDYSGNAFQQYCRTEAQSIGHVKNILGKGQRAKQLRKELTHKKAWLNAAEYYYLLERRAIRIFNNLEPDDTLSEAFNISYKGKQFSVQLFQLVTGGEESREYYITEHATQKEATILSFEAGHPLIKWLDTEQRNSLLIEYFNNRELELAYEDFPLRRLILLDDSYVGNYNNNDLRTIWIAPSEKNTVIRHVNIENNDPYTSRPLSRDILKNIFSQYFDRFIEHDWQRIAFGLAPYSKKEIALLIDKQQVYIGIAEKSENEHLFENPVHRNSPTLALDTLNSCFGGELKKPELLSLLLRPDDNFNKKLSNGQFTYVHPLVTILANCKPGSQ